MSANSVGRLCGIEIDDWQILAPLGSGQSGEVYEVRETRAPFRHGALKILRGPKVRIGRWDFLREVCIVSAQPIPGRMPAFFTFGRWQETIPYFVMEFAEKLPERFSPKEFEVFIDSLAESVHLLSRVKFLHNDIKPGNLGIINGKPVLLDFGCACRIRKAASHRMWIGTPYYTAPEVKDGGVVSLVSNIYSIGMTMDEICPEPLQRIFGPLAHTAASIDAADRPQTIADFRRRLGEAITSYRSDAAHATRLDRFKIVVKRVGRTFVAFMMVMVLFCGLRYILTLIRDQETIQNNTDFETARECHRRGDYTNEVRHLLPVATSNSRWKRQACRILANRYREGQGVERDLEKSRAFHDEANKGESQ